MDFSAPPRHLGFGLIGSNLPTAPYSRESTPDSGGSHYIDNYRDPSGKFELKEFYCKEIDVKILFLQGTARTPAMEWLNIQVDMQVMVQTLINAADLMALH